MWFATECRKCLSEACVSLTHWTNFNQEEAPSFFFGTVPLSCLLLIPVPPSFLLLSFNKANRRKATEATATNTIVDQGRGQKAPVV